MKKEFPDMTKSERKYAFSEYLFEKCSLSKGTVGHYLTALSTISNKLKKTGLIECDLFEVKIRKQIDEICNFVLSDSEFIKMNKVGNRMYSSGIKKYRNFANNIIDFKPRKTAHGKLSQEDLHRLLLLSLGDCVEAHSDIEEKPLVVQLGAPYNWTLKVFLFNCTNPPGARQAGEYKCQLILPGQKRGEKGYFQIEAGVTTLIMGFASVTGEIEDGSFIIWELEKHMEFAFSANIQVSLDTLLKSLQEPVFAMKKRGNKEWIVVARPDHLLAGIKKRIDIDISILLGEI